MDHAWLLYNARVIQIRPAQAQDQNVIRKMVWNARLDPTTLQWQNFVVAESIETTSQPARIKVGIAQIRPYSDCRELGSVVVLPNYRGGGIARQLIETLLAKEAGDVYLDCERSKIPLYTRFGFEVIAFDQMPRTLKIKALGARLLRLFGIHVVCMKRTTQA